MADETSKKLGAAQKEADDGLEQIDFAKVREPWQKGLKAFEQKASLEIARWILVFFGLVLGFCCYIGYRILRQEGAMTYNNALELIRTMLSAILPLATLAVSYYLGEKSH